jgi:hypothetical protein
VLAGFYFVMVRHASPGEYAPPDLHYGGLVAGSAVVGFSIGFTFGLLPLNHVLLFKNRKSFMAVVLLPLAVSVMKQGREN